MWQLIKDAISGLAALVRWKEKADDRANAPEIVANARAKDDAKIRDAAASAVAADDLEKIRKLGAE